MADKTDRPIFSNVPSGSGTAGPWQTLGVSADATGSGVSARVYSRAQHPPGKIIADAAALAATASDFKGQIAVQLLPAPMCIHLGDGAGGWIAYEAGSMTSVWGSITGTLSGQTDLQAALDALQAEIDALDTETAAAALTAQWGGITGTLSGQTDLQAALDALTAAIAGKAALAHEHAAADVTSGTFNSARIPVAGTGSIGGLTRAAGSAGQYVEGWDSNGVPQYSTPAGAGSGSVTSVAISGTDGLEVDSGSPITTTGTIQLGVNAAALRTYLGVEADATLTTFAALEALHLTANQNPDTYYLGTIDAVIPMEDNLSDFHSSGVSHRQPPNLRLKFTANGGLDFGRNVRQFNETAITADANGLLFTLTAHGLLTNDIVFYRSNAPLPRYVGYTRVQQWTPYWVLREDDNTFRIEASIAGGALGSTGTGGLGAACEINLVDVWMFRGITLPGAIASNIITCRNHGMQTHQVFRIWDSTSAGAGTSITTGVGSNFIRGSALGERRFVSATSFTVDTVRLKQLPDGAAITMASSGSGTHLICGHFELQHEGPVEAACNQQIYFNFAHGIECLQAGQSTGAATGSVFGSFGGCEVSALWWTGPTAELMYPIRVATGLLNQGGGQTNGNPRWPDKWEGMQAAIIGAQVKRAGTPGTNENNPDFIYQLETTFPTLTFPGGAYRYTDTLHMGRSRGQNWKCAGGGKETHFINDIWPGIRKADYYDSIAFSLSKPYFPKYVALLINEGSSGGGGIEGLQVIGTFRVPFDSAAVWLAHGGTMENFLIKRMHVTQYGRYALAFGGPQGVNHPTLDQVYVQMARHGMNAAIAFLDDVSKVTITGSTLNQGAVPLELNPIFLAGSGSELVYNRVHLENQRGGVMSFDSGLITLADFDMTATERDYMFTDEGAGTMWDGVTTCSFVNAWPLSNSSRWDVLSYDNSDITSPFELGIRVTSTGTGIAVGDHVALFGEATATVGGALINNHYIVTAVNPNTPSAGIEEIRVAISGTASSAVASAEATLATVIAGVTVLLDKNPVIFQDAMHGMVSPLGGLTLDKPYYACRGQWVDFSATDVQNVAGALVIQCANLSKDGVTQIFNNGDVAKFCAPRDENAACPTNLEYNKFFYIVNSSPTAVSLALTSGGAAIAYVDSSRWTGNSMIGGEESYGLLGIKYALANSLTNLTRTATVAGTASVPDPLGVTLSGTPPASVGSFLNTLCVGANLSHPKLNLQNNTMQHKKRVYPVGITDPTGRQPLIPVIMNSSGGDVVLGKSLLEEKTTSTAVANRFVSGDYMNVDLNSIHINEPNL